MRRTCTELTPFTNKVTQIDHGLVRGCAADSATALYDAIFLGSEEPGRRKGARCWCWSPTAATRRKSTTYAEALEQALRNEVMIYCLIDVPIEASAGRDTRRRARADHPR